MTSPTTAYPLAWPLHKPRTPTHRRERSNFGTRRSVTPGRVRDELVNEIALLGGREVIISTNVPLRRDGLPYASASPVDGDPAAAVYFNRKGKPHCFACDQWQTVDENLWAIRKTIEALRGVARWGSGDMMEQAFTGFVALPAPEQPWNVLAVGMAASRDEVEAAYRRLAMRYHPDRGGDAGEMARINAARDAMFDRLTRP